MNARTTYEQGLAQLARSAAHERVERTSAYCSTTKTWTDLTLYATGQASVAAPWILDYLIRTCPQLEIYHTHTVKGHIEQFAREPIERRMVHWSKDRTSRGIPSPIDLRTSTVLIIEHYAKFPDGSIRFGVVTGIGEPILDRNVERNIKRRIVRWEPDNELRAALPGFAAAFGMNAPKQAIESLGPMLETYIAGVQEAHELVGQGRPVSILDICATIDDATGFSFHCETASSDLPVQKRQDTALQTGAQLPLLTPEPRQ